LKNLGEKGIDFLLKSCKSSIQPLFNELTKYIYGDNNFKELIRKRLNHIKDAIKTIELKEHSSIDNLIFLFDLLFYYLYKKPIYLKTYEIRIKELEELAIEKNYEIFERIIQVIQQDNQNFEIIENCQQLTNLIDIFFKIFDSIDLKHGRIIYNKFPEILKENYSLRLKNVDVKSIRYNDYHDLHLNKYYEGYYKNKKIPKHLSCEKLLNILSPNDKKLLFISIFKDILLKIHQNDGLQQYNWLGLGKDSNVIFKYFQELIINTNIPIPFKLINNLRVISANLLFSESINGYLSQFYVFFVVIIYGCYSRDLTSLFEQFFAFTCLILLFNKYNVNNQMLGCIVYEELKIIDKRELDFTDWRKYPPRTRVDLPMKKDVNEFNEKCYKFIIDRNKVIKSPELLNWLGNNPVESESWRN